jgi:6-phosphogluconolactonase (cycloisomerase 2 family)
LLGRTLAAVAAAVWVVAATDARAATVPGGVLAQLGGRGGCLYDPRGGSAQGLHVDLPGRCTTAESLDGAYDAAMSPDGRNVYVASFQADSISAFARDRRSGRLTQLTGAAGCHVDDPFDSPCSAAPALDGVSSLAVSPDGRNLYAVSFLSNALVVFSRDRASGEVLALEGAAGCLAEIGVDYDCGPATSLRGATAVAVSRDGRNVYVSSAVSSSVAVFRRDAATGALRQLEGAAGCVREFLLEVEEEGDVCATAPGLDTAISVAVSADGRNVYVASFGSAALAVFARNGATGALTALPGTAGCLSEERAAAACAPARGLEGAFAITVSPDGRNVYVATGFDRRLEPQGVTGAFGASGVAVFARNRSTGALRQLAGRAGCVSEERTRGGCADGRALEGSIAVEVSQDGGNVYVAASASNAVSVFARDARTGALRQLAGRAGCVSETGTDGACRDGTGLWGASAIALSPDGRHAYAPGFFSSALAAFTRSAPARRGGR